MKLLVVGHAYIAPINREKWEVFARQFPHDQVTVIIPDEWPDVMFTLRAGDCSSAVSNLTFIPLRVKRAGNEVMYRYRWLDLFTTIKAARPDVLYVEQGDNALSYLQTLIVGKLVNAALKTCFFTWVNWKHDFGWKYRFIWSFVERLNLWLSDCAIVGNHEAEKILHEKGFLKPIMVLPQLGMNTHFLPAKKEVVSEKRVCFVGRFVKEKGVELLLEAFYELALKYPEWKLYFVGSGPLENQLKKSVEAFGLSDRVVFTGPLSHEAVIDFLVLADCMVLPSYDVPTWKEQFGHVIVEAMALGVPVIGTTGGAIPWVIGDAGIVVEQGNKESLKGGLDSMMNDAALRNFYSDMGKERVKNFFTHEIIAAKTRGFLVSREN